MKHIKRLCIIFLFLYVIYAIQNTELNPFNWQEAVRIDFSLWFFIGGLLSFSLD